MKFNDKQSVYSQIATEIKRKIYIGEIKTNQALPSVRNLASDYQVTIKTIQNTIASLEEEGVVIKRSGIGTFVSDDESAINRSKENYINSLIEDFLQGMQSIGIDSDQAVTYINGGVKND
jgi:DNA-binding transcriptional regulator YhcF (GntR family)